jgi:hypothetical protein
MRSFRWILNRLRLNVRMAWAALWSNGMIADTFSISDGVNTYKGVFFETRKKVKHAARN